MMMPNKLVSYSEKKVNIGDAIQTIAIEQFLKSRGIQIDGYVDRKNMTDNMIINGWHRHKNERLPSKAFFIGVHTDRDHLKDVSKDCTIGCRDEFTLKCAQELGFNSALSYCATTTFEKYNGHRHGIIKKFHGEKEINDNSSIDKQLLAADQVLKKNASLISRAIKKFYGTNEIDNNASFDKQVQIASQILGKLRTANLVYTDRLHIALPCIAFGTPVILTPRKFQPERYSIFNVPLYPGHNKVVTSNSGLREYFIHEFNKSFDLIWPDFPSAV